MKDGSKYEIANKCWQKAFNIKYGTNKKEIDEIKKIFIELIDRHWKTKTIPTKFGFSESWKNTDEGEIKPKNQAELGDYVMYQYIRTALMGIMFSEMEKKDAKKEKRKPKPVCVIGMNDDGTMTRYDGRGKRKYKSCKKILKEDVIK
jgi:hypothetical protein